MQTTRQTLQRARRAASLGMLLLGGAGPATAQIDYRNLDDDRPAFVEDAYPVERWAFELLAPWRYEREADGGTLHLIVPELAYGLHRNLQVGIKLPLAGAASGAGDRTWGVAGLRAFALYNFNTEAPALPALSLRADAGLPVGGLGGEGTRVGLKAIATRSFGWQRVHLNASWGVGAADRLPVAEAIPAWSAGVAVDRTLFRQSLLLVVETYAKRLPGAGHTGVAASVGARWQLTPTVVLDGGVGRRLGAHGPDVALTLGLSHAFAVRALMPRPPRAAGGGDR